MKKYLFLLLLIGLGCKNKAFQPAVHIGLIDNYHALKITGINPVILNDIDRDTVKNWQSLFAIFRLPADTDLKDYQLVQPGKYRVSNGSVTFTPDTPFTTQQAYFMRFYNYTGNKTIWDYIRGRTKPGQLHYTDLIFRP